MAAFNPMIAQIGAIAVYAGVIVAAYAVSRIATEHVREHAIRKQFVDRPNHRSMHEGETPRGGGLAIVAITIVAAFVLAVSGLQRSDQLAATWQSSVGWAIAVPGLVIAAIGAAGDATALSWRLRLLLQTVAATVGIAMLGGLGPLWLPGFATPLDLGWVGFPLAVLGVLWLTNLYNFMDGIDGIAGAEAVSSAALGAIICHIAGLTGLALLLTATLGATIGFLHHNWPPAKIFMGDLASCFLGFAFALLAVAGTHIAPNQSALPGFWFWLILLAVFVSDATFTLLRRLLRGEKPYEAHRSHAYQIAARRFGDHRPVTLAVLGINTLWLTPLALIAAGQPAYGPHLFVLAVIPLIALCVWLGAGTKN